MPDPNPGPGPGPDLPGKLPAFEPGWVWLAGAGPGDPGLLTLYALHALRGADVVVYDALISGEILALANPGAERVFAGKRGGKPSPKQVDISRRLIDYARAGRRVLRLKGGDPLLFGRGAEEALALVEAGVRFRIIPGVSSGVGGLAYAGIPLTHRDLNSSVTFITGHNANDAAPNALDWQAIARSSPVIVVFMALKHLHSIAHALLQHGRAPAEPVAIVSSATTPRQQVVITCLGQCAAEIERQQVRPPSLVVIGEVVKLRAGLDWLGALGGRTLHAHPLDGAAGRRTEQP